MDKQIFFNLVTRDALVLWRDTALVLDGPFQSKEEAETAADELIARMDGDAGDLSVRLGN